MTDDSLDEEFAPIAAAMKRLPYFEPSPQFAERVMARVRIAGRNNLPQVVEAPPVRSRTWEMAPAPADAPVPVYYFPRSLPARIAAVALLASLSVTMAAVTLFAMFQMDLFVLVARVFGEGAIGFLATLGADGVATVSGISASAGAAAGTLAGLAIAGSFAGGAIAATAGLRAAAAASRKAA